MTLDRVLKLFTVATVLGAAWHAGRESGPGMAIPVAIVGFGAAYWRAVLGIPMAVAMAAVAVYFPGMAIAAAFVVVFLVIVAAYVSTALRHGPIRRSDATSLDANPFFGMSGGVFDGGGCDGI